MLEDIKIMLGEAASNYTDELISLIIKDSLAEVEAYCNRSADYELETVAKKIAIIKLNRINSEGLASQSYSGVSESYINGYPAEIMAVLNRKRKIKVV
jgi:hypothetical protein